jgi:AraC-like DNA-binding protein
MIHFKTISELDQADGFPPESPLELIHLYVVSEAKKMLVEDNHSISEIAYQLGFENPPYFSRLFKKEVGMSPKEFKNHFLN